MSVFSYKRAGSGAFRKFPGYFNRARRTSWGIQALHGPRLKDTPRWLERLKGAG